MIYLLFQTDVWKTRASRVFFGAFTSKEKAISAAKEADLFTCNSEVLVIECEIDKIEEQ